MTKMSSLSKPIKYKECLNIMDRNLEVTVTETGDIIRKEDGSLIGKVIDNVELDGIETPLHLKSYSNTVVSEVVTVVHDCMSATYVITSLAPNLLDPPFKYLQFTDLIGKELVKITSNGVRSDTVLIMIHNVTELTPNISDNRKKLFLEKIINEGMIAADLKYRNRLKLVVIGHTQDETISDEVLKSIRFKRFFKHESLHDDYLYARNVAFSVDGFGANVVKELMPIVCK